MLVYIRAKKKREGEKRKCWKMGQIRRALLQAQVVRDKSGRVASSRRPTPVARLSHTKTRLFQRNGGKKKKKIIKKKTEPSSRRFSRKDKKFYFCRLSTLLTLVAPTKVCQSNAKGSFSSIWGDEICLPSSLVC